MNTIGIEHIFVECEKPCKSPESCIYCNGKLRACKTCGCSEGELLSYCPGYILAEDTKDDIYFHKKVIDFYDFADENKKYKRFDEIMKVIELKIKQTDSLQKE